MGKKKRGTNTKTKFLEESKPKWSIFLRTEIIFEPIFFYNFSTFFQILIITPKRVSHNGAVGRPKDTFVTLWVYFPLQSTQNPLDTKLFHLSYPFLHGEQKPIVFSWF